MYRETGHYSRPRRKKKRTKIYLRTVLMALSIICITIVCVTIALRAKDSRVSAENLKADETAEVINTADMAQATDGEEESDETPVSDSEEEEEEERNIIVIDPGHGGKDGGCSFGGVLEKDINREIASVVVDKLEDKGYEVLVVRQGDDFVSKQDRVDAANKQKALIYVAIHQNSYEMESISGIETWYYADDETGESKRLAEFVHQEAVSATGAKSRQLVADTGLYVLNKTDMPACLIETGFLSNNSERAKLSTEEYREQMAEGIVAGIELYLNS